jgi:hypothetical protein
MATTDWLTVASSPPSVDQIPAIVTEARSLIEQTRQWTPGKVYFGKVQTLRRPSPSSDWFARRSLHEDITYNEFRSGIFLNHTINEQKYIDELESVERINTGDIDDASGKYPEVWNVRYNLKAPLVKNRDFLMSIVTHEDDNEFYVISLSTVHPACPSREDYIRGRYTAVERVKKCEDGNVEWIAASSSDPKGLIPTMFANLAVPKKMAEDVPSYEMWIKKKRLETEKN